MSRRPHPTRPRLGSGKRFASLTEKIEKEGKSPEAAKAIAAAAGRKAHGDHKMAEWAAKGRKKKED